MNPITSPIARATKMICIIDETPGREGWFPALLSDSGATKARLTDRSQLKLRYGHHHQQPQQHSHYDELDPFRSGVREPSKHFVEATHGQPSSGCGYSKPRQSGCWGSS